MAGHDDGEPGPVLGIHLGMSGKMVLATDQGDEIDGGDSWGRGRAGRRFRYWRFNLMFAGGGALMLVETRRA